MTCAQSDRMLMTIRVAAAQNDNPNWARMCMASEPPERVAFALSGWVFVGCNREDNGDVHQLFKFAGVWGKA